MKSNNEICYDEEVDILMLSKKRQVKHSIDCNQFIIDIDFSGAVSGVEVLDATRTLNLKKDVLKTVQSGNMQVQYRQSEATIIITLTFSLESKEIEIPLKVNLGKNHTRTEETCFAVA